MSVRSENAAPVAQMSGMEISPTAIAAAGNDHVTATINAAQTADSALAEHNSLSTNHPDRTFHTPICTPRSTPISFDVVHTHPVHLRFQTRFAARLSRTSARRSASFVCAKPREPGPPPPRPSAPCSNRRSLRTCPARPSSPAT